jgi:hypothetical protein
MRYLLALAALAAVAAARPVSLPISDDLQAAVRRVNPALTLYDHRRVADLDTVDTIQPESYALCTTCVSFMASTLNRLIGIIEQIGVLGGCSKVCGYLANQLEATVCVILCDVVGMEEFGKIINGLNPDPIFYCEELTVCPKTNNARATITSVNTVPASGRQGTEFDVTIAYTVHNTTGTGELDLDILPPQGFPLGGGNLIVDQVPAKYTMSFKFKTQPTQEQPFAPGMYIAAGVLCEGTCGSNHPYSYLLSQVNGTFHITQ